MSYGFFLLNEIDVNERGQQSFQLTWMYAYSKQCASLTCRILDKGCGPLWLCIQGVQIIVRKNRNSTLSLNCSLLRLQDKVRPWPKVPCLDLDREASFFQLPGNPLSPIAISFVVANKKVLAGELHPADLYFEILIPFGLRMSASCVNFS